MTDLQRAAHRGSRGFHRAISAIRPNVARDVIAALLNADDLDAAALAKITTREHFPDAAAALLHVIRPKWGARSAGLVGALYAHNAIALPARVASFFAIFPSDKDSVQPRITLDSLRRVAASKNASRARHAKIALAILNEPVARYADLSRRERAGLLLGLLVAAWRERPS
jgi:hypothetical protein